MRDEKQQARYLELIRVLSEEEYAAVVVPTREQIREALRKGAEEMRQMKFSKPKGRY